MSDVFLSYASRDRERILPLVRALEEEGFSVWWDRDIPAGASWDREIERALAGAGCVVVVWSSASVNSEYVRSEAQDAADRDILVPVVIDNVKSPLAHRRRQAAILTNSFDTRDSEYRKLSAGIRAVLGKSASAPAREPSGSRFTRSRKLAWILPILLLLPLMAGAFVRRDAIMTSLILNFPSLFFGEPIKQEIGFTTTQDGVRIAYATSGAGMPIVQVLSVGTHIESGQFSPV